jgi:hypothetical protein
LVPGESPRYYRSNRYSKTAFGEPPTPPGPWADAAEWAGPNRLPWPDLGLYPPGSNFFHMIGKHRWVVTRQVEAIR